MYKKLFGILAVAVLNVSLVVQAMSYGPSEKNAFAYKKVYESEQASLASDQLTEFYKRKEQLDKPIKVCDDTSILPLEAYIKYVHNHGYQSFNLDLLQHLVELKKGDKLTQEEGSNIIYNFVADNDIEAVKIMRKIGNVDPGTMY